MSAWIPKSKWPYYIFLLNSFSILPVCAVSKCLPLHKKWSFPLRNLLVNLTKSAGARVSLNKIYQKRDSGTCGFGRIYWENPYLKNSSSVQRQYVYLMNPYSEIAWTHRNPIVNMILVLLLDYSIFLYMTFYKNCLFFVEVVNQEKKAKFSFWAGKV